ncbi:hypothetical protein FB451DRAFT_1391064 [Mycena latifolia]|nr:hypothetical protein FB451DRAFT_1391064 [Mycena latifolia]
MIIASESDLKDVKQLDIVVNRAVPDDPPPAYFTSQSPPKSQVATSSELPPLLVAAGPQAPDDVKPTNFLSLSRGNGSIKGTYVIDPRVKIPPSLLPPLAPDETEAARRNLFMHTSSGSVDVDLFVVGDGEVKGKKVNMFIKSSNGSLTARIHAPIPARPPIHLTAHSANGSITLHLTRSFRGPVTARARNGSVKFSGALEAEVTTFGEAERTRRCFVGDFSDWAEGEAWGGDEVIVESGNGSVKIQFDAEADLGGGVGKEKGKGAFFGRLLGL